jgi:hypothetical protein
MSLSYEEEEYLKSLEAKYGKDIADKQRTIFENQLRQRQQQVEQPIETEENEESEIEETENWRDIHKRKKEDSELREQKKRLMDKIEKELEEPTDFSRLKISELPLDARLSIQKKVDEVNAELRRTVDVINAKLEAQKLEKQKIISDQFNELLKWSNEPIIQNHVREFIQLLYLMTIDPLNNVEWRITLLNEATAPNKVRIVMLKGNYTQPKEPEKKGD